MCAPQNDEVLQATGFGSQTKKLDNKKHIIARIFLLRNRHKRPRGQPGWLCLLITHFSQKAGQPPMLTGMEGMGSVLA